MSKKATEILLDLDFKVTRILQFIQNLDSNYKLLLNRLNALEAKSLAQPAPLKRPKVESPNISDLDLQKEAQAEAAKDISKLAASAPSNKPKVQSGKTSKKVPVEQLVKYSDGSVVYRGNYKILDSKSQIVKEGRTNNSGKWLAALEPGEYTVQVVRGKIKDKPPVDLEYQIVVEASDRPIQLPDHIME